MITILLPLMAAFTTIVIVVLILDLNPTGSHLRESLKPTIKYHTTFK